MGENERFELTIPIGALGINKLDIIICPTLCLKCQKNFRAQLASKYPNTPYCREVVWVWGV